jgi:hypothetical protein
MLSTLRFQSRRALDPLNDEVPMTTCLLIFFIGVCVFLLGWGMSKPGRICEFPFLAGATFAGFVLPQAVGLTWEGEASLPGLDEALGMSILCALMCYLGYVISDTPASALNWQFDNERLLVVSAVLSAIGGFFFFLIARLPDELVVQAEKGGWTGLPVAYLFFARLLQYGFAIALLLCVRCRSKGAVTIIAFDCFFLFDWIVIRGRRAFAIEFVLFFLCAFWFIRRRTLPRWGALIMVAAGTVMVSAAPAYRATVYKDQGYGGSLKHDVPWEDVLKIDFLGEFAKNAFWEFKTCAYCIHTTDSFDGGLSYWNELVYGYVPAQLLGLEFKTSLQFDVEHEVRHPYAPVGVTTTGMGDSFQAFGWFGCLVFFLIAFVMRKVFRAAESGHFAAQVAYMVVLTSAMHTVTHHTKWFLFSPWVHMALFLLPCLLWARKPLAGKRPGSWVGKHLRASRLLSNSRVASVRAAKMPS